VAIGSNLSGLWILIANSFMQEPVGYVLRNGRAEMADFGALLANPHVWVQFPHVFFAGLTTAAFFVLGISAYHLLKKRLGHDLFRRSFQMAVVYALIGSVMVALVGHVQGQHMIKTQPMKMAAAEALWETEQPASLSLFAISDQSQRRDVFAIKLPRLLSLLSCNNLTCEVQGINNLQAEYEQLYGPGDYIPPVTVSFWAFRGMVGSGLIMPLLALLSLYLLLRNRLEGQTWFLRLLPWAIPLPYLANSTGWILAEVGRQPWIVYGLMRVEDGVSPGVPAGTVLFSLLVFALLYAVLMGAEIYLLAKFARQETEADEESPTLAAAY
jgi:cytochrome d ubiquinol oxidase subunit I